MYEFKKPELDDKRWVDSILKRPDNMSCELCFGNLFIWSSVYHNMIVHYKDFFIAKNINETANVYSFPIGEGDLKDAFDFLIADAEADGKKCAVFGVTAPQKEMLDAIMPNAFHYAPNRDYFDYIYLVERLSTLSGKKLHSKRNHVSNFKKMYPNWSYEKITLDTIPECLEMHYQWIKENDPTSENTSYQNELEAVKLSFNHYEELEFSGGLIRVDGAVKAYTFGEAINNRVFCTHVEKAFSDMRGAYPIINQEFALHNLASFELVNREEDIGLEGLRKAKFSYRPDILLEKMNAVYEGNQ